MKQIQKHQNLIIICFLFTFLYSSISLINHYNFRTYALDLGLYTNALYDYIHFQWNDSTVFLETKNNLLADHFDIYLIIFSPLSLILGTYTLLIVQILAIIIGGVGVYKFFSSTKENSKIALFSALYFYSFFGIFGALAFDYHSNVVAATLVPWLFYSLAQRKILVSSLFIILIIIAKENMSLWLTFILFGLLFEYRKDLYMNIFLLIAAFFSLFSFVLITAFIMPAISTSGTYPHFHYSYLGENIYQAVIHLILHPIESIKVLFTNHNNSPHGDLVKIETHVILLTSGFILLLKKPQYILMLIPIYFQKFFHDNDSMWGIGEQYNIEFAPIFAIGIFKVISEINVKKNQLITSFIVLLFAIASTIRTLDSTVIFTDKIRSRFYKKAHYQKQYDLKSVYQHLSKIPDDATISSQSPFLPHLSLRDNIYQFPIIKNAEYIVYSRHENSYPLSKKRI